MSSVFIVRPFGKRTVLKKDKTTQNTSEVEFDFDKVEEELIAPAIAEFDLKGGTTGEIFEAGDIREDMFSSLLLADLVIADITIYNANVFYELGIRHALRDKRTILIKSPGFDDTPFDIIGYRYFSYNKEKPADALPDLIKAIEETMGVDRKDSPVFNVLTSLSPQDPERYLAVPADFTKEVIIAEGINSTGRLVTLADEAENFNWAIAAMRIIGEALFGIKSWNAAKTVWEKITEDKPNDIQANDRLATIYQRLAETEMKRNKEEGISLLIKSDMAIEIVLGDKTINSYQRAEAYSLKARNAKTRWIDTWKNFDKPERFTKALQSIYLDNSFKNYEKGFYENLNHFYSGINAIGLLTTIISLGERFPGVWELAYESTDEANQKLMDLKNKLQRLSATLQVSIDAAKKKLENTKELIWALITEVDLTCLTSSNPQRVQASYTRLQQTPDNLNTDAIVRQLKIYEALEVKPDNIKAALSALPRLSQQENQTVHYLLFTGHMIDKADRENPRFPASKETAVKQVIKDKIIGEKNKLPENSSFNGIAGGACGGDILFHEICMELKIPTKIYLALPEDKFKVESVAFAGPQWMDRFNKLVEQLPHPVLCDDKELPKWLQKKKDYTIWERNNLWELNSALINGGINTTLIALWDGKGGDGPGGTADMVKKAEERGAKTIVIDINTI